jgi:hypothetical protein
VLPFASQTATSLRMTVAGRRLALWGSPLRTRSSGLAYIPGSFIPASLRAKLGLPICLNIFLICAYWRSRLFTS